MYIVKGVTYELVNIKLFGVIDGTVDLNKLHYTHKTKTKIHNTFTKKKKKAVFIIMKIFDSWFDSCFNKADRLQRDRKPKHLRLSGKTDRWEEDESKSFFSERTHINTMVCLMETYDIPVVFLNNF